MWVYVELLSLLWTFRYSYMGLNPYASAIGPNIEWIKRLHFLCILWLWLSRLRQRRNSILFKAHRWRTGLVVLPLSHHTCIPACDHSPFSQRRRSPDQHDRWPCLPAFVELRHWCWPWWNEFGHRSADCVRPDTIGHGMKSNHRFSWICALCGVSTNEATSESVRSRKVTHLALKLQILP